MKCIWSLLFLILSFGLTAQKYAEIDAFAKTIDLTKDYKQATKELIAPYEDDESKARAIFSWLAYNLEYDSRRLKKVTKRQKKGSVRISGKNEAEIKAKLLEKEQKAMNMTLRKKKGVCQDFAWLFDAMCFEAGIESEFVTGHGRTHPNELGRIPKGLGHAWNAAKIDGSWALFDVTWSTDMWERQGNGFFMLEPQEFLKSHYPSEEEWQLLDIPVDVKTWANQIFWYKGYERYAIGGVKAGSKIITDSTFPRDSLFTLNIELRPDQELYAMKNQGEKRAKLNQEGNDYLVDFKKLKFRGKTTIVLSEGTKFWPLLDVKVR